MVEDIIAVKASKLIEEAYQKVFEEDIITNGVVVDIAAINDKDVIPQEVLVDDTGQIDTEIDSK